MACTKSRRLGGASNCHIHDAALVPFDFLSQRKKKSTLYLSWTKFTGAQTFAATGENCAFVSFVAAGETEKRGELAGGRGGEPTRGNWEGPWTADHCGCGMVYVRGSSEPRRVWRRRSQSRRYSTPLQVYLRILMRLCLVHKKLKNVNNGRL